MSSNEIVFGGQGQAPDDVRDAIENERRNALSQSISFATTQDPKRIAESMRYGFGPLVPQQSLEAARRAETARKTYDSILNYPVTSSFFQDPAFASIAISDAPNIGLLENTARTLLAAPVQMAEAGLSVLEFAQGRLAESWTNMVGEIKAYAWSHMTPEQKRQFRQQDLARRGLTEYPYRGEVFQPVGEMLTTQMRRGLQEATEGLKPQTETILGEALVSAGTSIAQFAALLPLGPAGIMAGFGALEFGQGLEEGRKAGLTPDQQLRYAGFNAASEMGFAAAPLQGLFASAKGGSAFLRSFWQFSASEIPAEMATTLTQSFNRWAQIDSKQGQSFESWLSTLKREEAVTFLATLISSAGFSALAHRAEAQIATQAREQSLAESRANGLTQMADQFVDLSISEEAPDLARQLVNGIAQESGSVDRLRVDTSRLAEIIDQIGVNRVREVLPGVVEEIQQAGTEPGIEAEISPGDYFVAIKQLPELRAALEPHLRVGDSEYSSSEIEQAQAETQQFLADIEQTFNDLVTEARQRESDRSTIYRDVITQVLGADAANVLAAQEPVAAQELEAEPQPVEQPKADPVAVEAITEAIPPEVSQVVQAMTEQMEEAAPEPAAEVEQAAPEPAQEQAPQPTEQQDFLSWFGTSQARTMAGVPMRLVETSPGIYTQSAEGPSGVAVSIRAPLKLTGGRAKQFLASEKARKSILAQARRSGNDGVIAYAKTKDESGKSVPNTVYAPLDADQVRVMPQSMDVLFAPPRLGLFAPQRPRVPNPMLAPGQKPRAYQAAIQSGDLKLAQKILDDEALKRGKGGSFQTSIPGLWRNRKVPENELSTHRKSLGYIAVSKESFEQARSTGILPGKLVFTRGISESSISSKEGPYVVAVAIDPATADVLKSVQSDSGLVNQGLLVSRMSKIWSYADGKWSDITDEVKAPFMASLDKSAKRPSARRLVRNEEDLQNVKSGDSAVILGYHYTSAVGKSIPTKASQLYPGGPDPRVRSDAGYYGPAVYFNIGNSAVNAEGVSERYLHAIINSQRVLVVEDLYNKIDPANFGGESIIVGKDGIDTARAKVLWQRGLVTDLEYAEAIRQSWMSRSSVQYGDHFDKMSRAYNEIREELGYDAVIRRHDGPSDQELPEVGVYNTGIISDRQRGEDIPAEMQQPDILYAPQLPRITPEQDAAYMEAVESGTTEDIESAERQAAEKVSKHVYRGFHGLSEGYLEGYSFDTSRLGQNTGAKSAEMGIFVGAKRSTASGYANAFPPDTVFDAAAADTVQPKVSQLQKDLKQRMSLHGERVEKVVDPRNSDISKIESSGAIDGSYYDLPHTDSYGKVLSQIQTYAKSLPPFTIFSSGLNARAMTEMALYDARDVDSSVSRYIDYISAEIELAKSANLTQRVDFLESELASAKETFVASRDIVSSIETVIKKVDLFGAIPQDGILDVWVLMDNPLVYDYEGRRYREETYADVVQRAIDLGHDGVVIKNTFDPGPHARVDVKDDIYVAFSPEQIKSRGPTRDPETGNVIPLSQRFDVTQPSILYGPEAPGPRVTPEQIATQAKLFSMMFSRLAQIMGVRSTDLWSRYGANILAGQLDGLTEQEQAAAIQRPGAYLPKKMTVILNQDQTASTLIHELTHHWMHVFETIASDVSNEQADAIRDEFQVLLDWFGVKDINAWQALPASEKAKHHETLAYNFEDYLATGKAPTNALRSIFRKIKDWFAALYTDLRGHLNESYRNQFGEDLPALTDDVRMLFDRMLGSEVAIARAKQTELAIPLFATQEESGLDDDQWAELQEAQRARDEEAIDKFRAQSVRDLKWSRNAQSRAIRKIQREASKRRKEIRSEVEAELRALPVYRAIDFLRKGQLRNEEGDTVEHEGSHRLSIESVKAEFDQDTVDALGYGRNGMLGKEGLHHDLVASVVGGFQDGTDLVRQVAAAKPLKEAVSERAEVVMRERHAELVDPKLIEAAAADSIRNQHHIRFISKTLRFVSRATQPESIMALAAKYAAQKTLERMTIRDIRPDRFSQAERRTGKEANKAWKSGDEALTTNLLRRQLGQAQLANESRVVRADIDKQIKFLRRLARADKRKAVGADYADYIDMVLSKVVVDRVQLAALPERTEPKTLADYASTVQAQGVPTAATPEFLAELNSRPATDYRDMSYEQLLEIVDLVKEIEQRGKIEHQDKLEFLQQSRQEVDGLLTSAVLANAPETKGEPSVTEQSQRFQANRAFYKYGIQQTTMATKAWFMDGGDYGPWFEYMVNTSSKLMDQEIARRAELTKKLEAILMPLFGSPLHGPGPFRDRLNRRMNIQEMFILACNLGNEGNIQRLQDGNGFDINDVMAEVSESLTADQLRAVQDVWDLFTSLRPEVARLERDTRNSEPIWVEPRPITLRSSDGQSVHLRGGYFPIVYDPIASTESMSLKDKEALESEVRQANAASATRQAYTKQRANRVVNRPLLFSMSNIYGSLEEIVHDLTWRKWSLDMNRILSDRSQLSKTILKKYGEIWLRDINDWRNRLIVDDVRAKNDFGGKIVAYTARYASSASLLYNIGSILIQPVGALAIRAATGGRAARAGLAKYLSNPLAAHREAREKSPALELRYLTRMREFADLETRIQGKSGARRTMEAFGWQLMAKTQSIADTIAWHSGYAMAIEKGHSEAKAVDIAYQVVLDTQSSGRTADLSSIETGAPWKRMFAVFYRVMNTQLNLAMRSAKDRNKATASKIVDMAAIFLVMPYVSYLLKDLITPDEEDDPEFWTVEKQAGIIANEAFQSALGSFWFIRDLGSLGNLFEGETPYAYRGPTGLRLIPDFAKLVEQISQGEMDKTLLKSFSTFLGDITGAPAAAINRMIDGFSAMMEGKDVPAYSILTGTQR